MLRRTVRRLTGRRRSHRVAFVVSSPRSGSTWLRTALSRHPDVLCTENRLFGDFFEMWRDEQGASPRLTLDWFVGHLVGVQGAGAMGLPADPLRETLVERLADEIFGSLAEQSGKSLIVDKVTPYLGTSERVMASIARHFPEAPVVELVRDGRDVATSGVFDWLLRGSEGTSRHDYFVARREDLTLERFFDDAVLLRWADMWAEPGRALARRGSSDLRVRYESMLDDPRVALRQLFERLQVPARAGILDDCVEGARFEVMSGGRRPGDMVATAKARRGVAGDWRNYFTRRDGELFEGRVGADLRRLGYADDAHWVDALPERLAWKPGQWRDAP